MVVLAEGLAPTLGADSGMPRPPCLALVYSPRPGAPRGGGQAGHRERIGETSPTGQDF